MNIPVIQTPLETTLPVHDLASKYGNLTFVACAVHSQPSWFFKGCVNLKPPHPTSHPTSHPSHVRPMHVQHCSGYFFSLQDNQNYPYLIVLKSLETYNYIVVVENETFVETETLVSAIMYLFATYSFNMAYPQGCYSVLILFQKYILGILSFLYLIFLYYLTLPLCTPLPCQKI